jgi:hypothetical protein
MVNENKTFFTHQQVKKARKARELYHGLGTSSPADLKANEPYCQQYDHTRKHYNHRTSFWTRHQFIKKKDDKEDTNSCCKQLHQNPTRAIHEARHDCPLHSQNQGQWTYLPNNHL